MDAYNYQQQNNSFTSMEISYKINNDPQQYKQQQTIPYRDTMRTSKLNKKWNRRLKFLFCCLGYKKNKDSFADVASIFADFFHDVDSTSTELVAGFLALAKFQKAQREWNINNRNDDIFQYLSCLPISSKTKFLDVSEADDSHLLNELIYYMNYSLAIFGWPMQMIDDPCMLCCIYPYLRIGPCCGRSKKKKKSQNKTKEQDTHQNKNSDDATNVKDNKATNAESQETNIPSNNNDDDDGGARIASASSTTTDKPNTVVNDDYDDTPIIIDDNCCSCNVASVERRLAVHNYEIIYVTYHVDVSRIPFLVAADHSKQTIVVSMRGSMSLDDVVTDMNGQIDKLPIKNCPDDWLCHRGISRASIYVKDKLIEDGILQRAFNCRPDLDSQDYTLVLCGHSLGAGAAAILGLLLRDQYPTLKAYLYSPPGGILSLPVVEYTKQFATSIILGNDCVPRLGVAQFERLRYHVYLSLKNAQQSPSRIITKKFCPSCCCSTKSKIEYDPDASVDLLHGSHGSTFEYRGVKIQFQVQQQLLYVPGRILHIVKNHSLQSRASRLLKGPVYQAVWVENTNYDRIMIANGMFCDHLPNNLMHAMKMLFVNTIPVRKNSKSPDVRCSSLVPSLDINNTMTSSSPLNQHQKKPTIYNSIDTTTTQTNLSVHDAKQNVIKSLHIADTDDNNNSCEIDHNHDITSGNFEEDKNSGTNTNNDNINININNNNNNNSVAEKRPEMDHHVDDNGNDQSTFDRNHVPCDNQT